MEAGLDSLGAVELRSALGARFGIELPTLTFDHPTPAALAAYLTAATAAAAGTAPAPPLLPNPTGLGSLAGPQASELVSISCRFPAPAGAGVDRFFSAAKDAADLPSQVSLFYT